jgi:D-aminopeptidase
VTVVHPGGNLFRSPVPAGGAVLNGAGECTGFLAAAEWGLAETPVFLTSTMQLGRVYDAACELLMAEEPSIGIEDVIIPIVAECDDSFLSEPRRMQVNHDDVRRALEAARISGGAEVPEEGAVGAGTGMSCLGFKGGIGSASRVTPSGHVVGVLLLSNFGERTRLTVDGLAVGRMLSEEGLGDGVAPAEAPGNHPPSGGSCIVVAVTDAPLDSAACTRLARRAGLGLARTGSTANHGSGEIFLALATGLRTPRGQSWEGRPGAGKGEERPRAITGRALDPFFAAVVEATEEAVLNSLLAARTVTGRDGSISHGLPSERVRELVAGQFPRRQSGDH